MKAYVDRDLCIGCGLCESICPSVFELDDEGLARVKLDEIPEELHEEVEDARAQCPTDAITTEE